MQQIILFFIRNKNFLLFLFLLTVSVELTIRSHDYHKNKFIHSANAISGSIFNIKNQVTSYFNLKHENKILIEENTMLRSEIENTRILNGEKVNLHLIDSHYRFYSADLISNSFTMTKNKLTLNKGSRQNIAIDMGVISSEGVIGIIDQVSPNYSTVMSILNTNSKINAKLKKSNHFGTLIWNTKDPNIVQLIDIPMLANPDIGDTITTGGRSTIFPEGIPIGTIKDFTLDKDRNYYNLNVQLFNDMTKIEHVYIIENTHLDEIRKLELGKDYVEK